jgi:hypothetical protein
VTDRVGRDEASGLQTESLAMRALRKLGRDDLAWPLRRLHVPVGPEALVLEIGSGGNPFPRSNVLLDAYENTRQRHFEPLVSDRPTVLGLIEKLPFRDDSFDFVIACHVIEHSTNVGACLQEMQRVATAGYIECPDAFFERVNPYKDHRLEITDRDHELRIRTKPAWVGDPAVVELFEAQVKPSAKWNRHLRENPFAFHLRYFWTRDSGGIRYQIEQVGDTQSFEGGGEEESPAARSGGIRGTLIAAVRGLLSQKSRNSALDLRPLLRCPACGGTQLEQRGEGLVCSSCSGRYAGSARFARLFPPA